ncbi:MAG: EamA family transporter [Syntrophobacterales bacterium]|nr:EamA family transporter [Syntrophobacterales bacterium]
MWAIYALLSALFAAMVAILGKIGLAGINSNVATAIHTAVALILAWGIVLFTGRYGAIHDLTAKNWLFLILAGCATGASWLCYYRALKLGDVSKVAPLDKLSLVITLVLAALILKESLSTQAVIGAILITIGTLMMIL